MISQKEKLKVLHVAPISIEISPNLKYAGTQRVIYNLNRGLSEMGYDSIVAGTGDSDLGGFGSLIAVRDRAAWPLSEDGVSRITRVEGMEEMRENRYEKVLGIATEQEVDLIHDHGKLAASECYSRDWKGLGIPIVTTEHCPITSRSFGKYSRINSLRGQGAPLTYISLSSNHRDLCSSAAGFEFDGFVYNGLELDKLPFVEQKSDYLFWGAARISDKKGTDLAVKIAREVGLPIILAGVVHEPDQDYHLNQIRPLLTTSYEGLSIGEQERRKEDLVSRIIEGRLNLSEDEVIFIGPVNDSQKAILYGHSRALTFPNRWSEPFGLTFAESLACGTPVLGTSLGSLPELVEDGKTGFLAGVEDGNFDERAVVNHLSTCVSLLDELDPRDSRNVVEAKFSISAMTQNYIDIYRRALNG